MDLKSPNFQFLSDFEPALLRQAAMAERYCLEDPLRPVDLTKLAYLIRLPKSLKAARTREVFDAKLALGAGTIGDGGQ